MDWQHLLGSPLHRQAINGDGVRVLGRVAHFRSPLCLHGDSVSRYPIFKECNHSNNESEIPKWKPRRMEVEIGRVYPTGGPKSKQAEE